MKIPELIEVWKIARAIGWPPKKTRLFFYDAGLAHKVGAHREALVVRADFEATMPVVYAIFVKAYASGTLLSSRGFGRSQARSSANP